MDATNSSVLWSTFPEYEFDTYWTIGMTSGDAAGQLPSTIGMPAGNDICSGSTDNGVVIRNRHSAQCFGWRGVAGFDRTSHHLR